MFSKLSLFFVLTLALVLSSCNAQPKGERKLLNASDFAAKMNEFPTATILDVRTPNEYSKGHVVRALNVDWNGDSFDTQTAALDKSKALFVYCLSGGRSAAAASQLRSQGFKEVYELDGGIMKWRAAQLPESKDNNSASAGMTKQAFDAQLVSEKYVLVDFYADWCAPCKKMKPYLEEISTQLADKVIVLRVNADDNQQMCKELHIDALPVLQLYKDNKMVWSHSGYIEKEAVLQQLK